MSDQTELPATVVKGFERLLSVQRPLVVANIRAIRKRRPNASPADIIRILERHYLTAVTTGGAAVGASAVVPGIGTVASLGLSGVETAGFLEASALFAQSVTEVHGIAIVEPERARSLVMALMLGSTGQDLVRQFAGQVGRGSGNRSAYWGELITSSLPKAMVGQLTDRLKRSFIRRFITRQGTSVLGRLVPFGVGAVVGGAGNHLLGRRVINAAREAFPPPPLELREELEARPRRTEELTAAPSRRLRVPRLGRKPAARSGPLEPLDPSGPLRD
ncbi:MAG: hypothetical protein JWR33_2249 [Naasia sp.]|jgi:hypothetical protein|uniref:hypothetical protein n=1 Tax=Naasia sp. TaxID=2546198 RepID=UPI00260DBB3C|nr:hypothetical protein [Naasia sp.]MCU1571508.1 hypothetical protein [Naasia sp.]